jgi:uncharacterized membrane protein
MMKYLLTCLATASVMLALDLLWLGLIAKPLYQQGIGHLMAPRPNIPAALAFYAIFALGLTVFAIVPNSLAGAWSKTLGSAALFGLVAYATYDLTNLATLKQWPLGLSLIDMAWGSLISAASAAAGKTVLDRFAAG